MKLFCAKIRPDVLVKARMGDSAVTPCGNPQKSKRFVTQNNQTSAVAQFVENVSLCSKWLNFMSNLAL